MNSTLETEQSNLLQALASHSVSSTFHVRGLQVYQANRAVLAERTLASTYPVIAQLIGVESFEPLARHFWQQYPPQCGDMGQWGAELPEFLEAAPQLVDEPFLADVARLEWALHRAASALDAVLDAPSFALLAGDTAQPIGLALSPGTYVLSSAYPVVSIVNAHLLGQPTIDEAADLLREGQSEQALVWRQGFKPRVRSISPAEFSLISALEKGATLEAALDAASSIAPSFDFNPWLSQAVQTGLTTGAISLPT
jgi:Putative DNA-binding domain